MEQLPFNEFCIYQNFYIDELEIKNKQIEEHNAKIEEEERKRNSQ